MRKVTKVSTVIIGIAIMLVGSPRSWGQAKKTAEPLSPRSVSAGASQMKKSSPNQVSSAQSVSLTSGSQKQSESNVTNYDPNDLDVAIAKTKALLQSGQSQNNLTSEQVSALKAKIVALEEKQALAKTKMVNNSLVPATEKVAAILVAKKFTRAEFNALNEQDQRQVLLNLNHLTVTDLVNSTPEALRTKSPNINFISANDFKGLNIPKQQIILQNPSNYIIVKDDSMIPRPTMTRAELNSLSPERRQAAIDAKQIQIID